jgi:hypothetical protein
MRHLFTLVAVVFMVCVRVDAQTGGVTITGRVTETVTLSVPRNFTQSDVHIDVVSSANNTVQITLSADKSESQVVRVPLLVRSNSGFKISALFESNTAVLTELSLTDVGPTGALVSPHVVSALEVMRRDNLDVSRPLLVLTGPRVSLGGTLQSPNNALQMTLLIRVQPQPGPVWMAHLTLAGTGVSQIQ